MQATDMRKLSRDARHERRVQVIRLRKAGHTYDVDIWVDTTNDGVYQPPPETPAQNGTADRSWRLSAASVHADVSLNFVWSTVYTDVAWP